MLETGDEGVGIYGAGIYEKSARALQEYAYVYLGAKDERQFITLPG